MADRFEFVGATDRPALLAITTPEWSAIADAALAELGYKVQSVSSHADFPGRFSQVQYQVVILEDRFDGTDLAGNLTLQVLQNMPMQQRRHATIILLSGSYETLNSLQAFQQSVHAIINFTEMGLFGQLVQKVVSENEMFLNSFREIEQRVARTKE